MSTADREHTAPDADANLPIEDLSAETLGAKTTDQVKGGAELRPKSTAHDVSNVQGKASS